MWALKLRLPKEHARREGTTQKEGEEKEEETAGRRTPVVSTFQSLTNTRCESQFPMAKENARKKGYLIGVTTNLKRIH